MTLKPSSVIVMSDRYKSEDTPWREESTLRQLYHDEGLSLNEVAEVLGTTKSTVIRWMNHHDIERRSRQCPWDGEPWQDEETLRQLYVEEGMSQPQIAEKFGCSNKTISRWMKKFDIKVRTKSDTPTSFHTNKRGYEICQDGTEREKFFLHQLLITVENDPHETFSQDNAIHHVNNISWDNRLENLELMSLSEHQKLHYQERVDRDGLGDGGVLQ